MNGEQLADRLLLRMDETARVIGVSRSKVYVLAASGQLPGVVRIGSSLRVSRQALEDWIAQNALVVGGGSNPPPLPEDYPNKRRVSQEVQP